MLKVTIIIFTVDKCKPISVYCFIYTPSAALWYNVTTFFEIEEEKVLKALRKYLCYC